MDITQIQNIQRAHRYLSHNTLQLQIHTHTHLSPLCVPSLCTHAYVHTRCSARTELFCQEPALLSGNNPFFLHVTLISHQDNLCIVPGVGLDLSSPKKQTEMCSPHCYELKVFIPALSHVES